MTIVGIILVFLLLGIIAYGFLMGFRQNMVQAAAEGARRGAVANPASTAEDEARAGVRDAVAAFDKQCGSDGLTCNVVVAPCVNKAASNCVTVTLSYDYAGHPLLPSLPFMDNLLPSSLNSKSVAEINS